MAILSALVAGVAAAPLPASQSLIPATSPWLFSAAINAYFPGDSQNYVQPTITADGNRLHLEARYNYENLGSASAWAGYNFSGGEKVQLDFTAMVGGVFGSTHGYAPGYEFTLSWQELQLYSEAEYVFDTGESSSSFFYTWSELTLAPSEWFQFGLAVERTQAYHTNFDIQRGFLVRFTHDKADLSVYLLNPDAAKPTLMLGVNLGL